MGNITTTTKQFDDVGMQFGHVHAWILEGSGAPAQRVVVQTQFEIQLSISGEVKRDQVTRKALEHPALTPEERSTYLLLCKKMHDYDAEHSKWVIGT